MLMICNKKDMKEKLNDKTLAQKFLLKDPKTTSNDGENFVGKIPQKISSNALN